MSPETKQQVQGCFFDLLVACSANVGEVIEIGFGLAYMTLMQHHNGDAKKAEEGMREALAKCMKTVVLAPPPLGIVPSGKLDS